MVMQKLELVVYRVVKAGLIWLGSRVRTSPAHRRGDDLTATHPTGRPSVFGPREADLTGIRRIEHWTSHTYAA